jgi:hypothetical protein
MDASPTCERIEEVPRSAEACAVVIEWRWRVQEIRRKIRSREPVLTQLAPEDVDRVISSRGCLGKRHMRKQERSGFAYVSGSSLRFRQRRPALWIFLKSDRRCLLKS